MAEIIKKLYDPKNEGDGIFSLFFGVDLTKILYSEKDMVLAVDCIFDNNVLNQYKDKIIAIHSGDLSITENMSRKYAGKDSILKAIVAGEKYTRSTAYLPGKNLYDGEIIFLSKQLEVDMPKDLEEFVKMTVGVDSKEGIIDKIIMNIKDNLPHRYNSLCDVAEKHKKKQYSELNVSLANKVLSFLERGAIAVGDGKQGSRNVYLDNICIGSTGFQL